MYKQLLLAGTVGACIFLHSCGDSRASGKKSEDRDSSVELSRAKEGDSVWVFLNHVKADQRKTFENFIHTVFWDASAKLPAVDQRVFKQTRVLHPTGAENDGSYTYMFIMDPVIASGDYDIERLLKKMYPEEKAKQEYERFLSSQSSEQTGFYMVQSRH